MLRLTYGRGWIRGFIFSCPSKNGMMHFQWEITLEWAFSETRAHRSGPSFWVSGGLFGQIKKDFLLSLQISHTFQNYPPGVRYIWFQHGGQDTQFWAGWYGIRVTNSSITIGPLTMLWRHNMCLLLPQDCNQVVSGALTCLYSLGECPGFVLHSWSQTQARSSPYRPGPLEGLLSSSSSSCTVDVTAITSTLPKEEG